MRGWDYVQHKKKKIGFYLGDAKKSSQPLVIIPLRPRILKPLHVLSFPCLWAMQLLNLFLISFRNQNGEWRVWEIGERWVPTAALLKEGDLTPQCLPVTCTGFNLKHAGTYKKENGERKDSKTREHMEESGRKQRAVSNAVSWGHAASVKVKD